VDFLKAADIVTLCVFRSTQENVKKPNKDFGTEYDDGHALSDRKGRVYKEYQVKGSTKAMPEGMMEQFTNKKYKKFISIKLVMSDTSGIDGLKGMNQLPADFLIDENGTIVDLLYATSFKEHMPFDRLEKFIPEGKRCNCNKKNCISTHCRQTYEEIRKENEAMFGGA